jgi:hypothetical protein
MPHSFITDNGPQGNFQIDKYSGEEISSSRIQRAVEIIEASFPRWPQFEIGFPSIDHLRWKLEYPGWIPNRLNIASMDGVEAYVCLTIYRVFSIGKKLFRVREAQDDCVHPDFRRRGVYSLVFKNSQTRSSEVDFVFRSMINPKVISTVKKYRPGYIDLGSNLKALIKPIAPSRELAERYLQNTRPGLKHSALSAAISSARIFRSLQRSKAPENNHLEIRRIEDTVEILDLFDFLLHEIPRPSGLFQERNRDYLRWRYCDPRGGCCNVLFAFDKGEPVGVAVCKMSEGIGYLIDLFTDSERQDVASELVGATDNFLEQKGAIAIVCRVLRDAPLRKTLRSHGYIPAPLQTGCLLSPAILSITELESLLENRYHHIMMGDFDWA